MGDQHSNEVGCLVLQLSPDRRIRRWSNVFRIRNFRVETIIDAKIVNDVVKVTLNTTEHEAATPEVPDRVVLKNGHDVVP